MTDNPRATEPRSSLTTDPEQPGAYYGRGTERGAAYGQYGTSPSRDRSYYREYGNGDEHGWRDVADTRTLGALALGAILGLAGTLLVTTKPYKSVWDGRSRGQRTRGDASRPRIVETDETADLIASNKVEGTAVYDRQGNKLGQIENFMVGKRTGRVAYAVMSFGGLLGFGTSHYPLPWSALDYDPNEGGYVVNLHKDRLKGAPSHKANENGFTDPNYGRRVTEYWLITGSTPTIL